jgi:hypothetical protein
VSVCGKERHLTVRIATIGAMRVGLNEFSDLETIRGFARRDCQVLAHESASLKLNVAKLKSGAGLEKPLGMVSTHLLYPGMTFLFGKALSTFANFLQYQFKLPYLF